MERKGTSTFPLMCLEWIPPTVLQSFQLQKDQNWRLVEDLKSHIQFIPPLIPHAKQSELLKSILQSSHTYPSFHISPRSNIALMSKIQGKQ